jgi:hypothetical protein
MNLLSGIEAAGVQAEIVMSHKPLEFRNGHRREKSDSGFWLCRRALGSQPGTVRPVHIDPANVLRNQ